MIGLTARQGQVLRLVAAQCPHDGCTGGCNQGWYEPVEGRTLTVARRLDAMALIVLANGSNPRWTAAHVTAAGRMRLAQRDPSPA